jgi:hypothetical protein
MNFTTSKTKKNIEKFGDDHNIEKLYERDQNVKKGKDQNIKSVFWVHHYYDKNQTFDVLILPMASKKITTSKIKISTTYGVLPMDTKACGGLG